MGQGASVTASEPVRGDRASGQSVTGNLPIARREHLLAAHTRRRIGPTLIAIGGAHGNEPAGVEAMKRVAKDLTAIEDRLRGRVYFVVGDTRALDRGVRYIDTDLNRSWNRENITSLGTAELCRKVEGLEMTELDELFDTILVTARNEVYVVDLHSTSAEGVPFATVGDTLRNRHFAQMFPLRILLGIEERLRGTMLEYLNNLGCVTLGFEGGSHDSPQTVDNDEALIWLSLVNAGVIWEEDVPRLDEYRKRLAGSLSGAKIMEVRHREQVRADDRFAMKPGFNNFDPVVKGEVLASNRFGDIRAPESGLLLMPLYQKLGEDGFFIGRSVSSFWIWLSEVLRRLRVYNLVELLPGVAAERHDRETLVIDTAIARFFPLQIFHLLGFRRRQWRGRKLVVSRRRHDVKSPFLGQKYG